MMRTLELAKKLLVSVLSLSLALGLIPTSALAEEAEGIDEIAEFAEEGQGDEAFVEDGSEPAASQDDVEQGMPADEYDGQAQTEGVVGQDAAEEVAEWDEPSDEHEGSADPADLADDVEAEGDESSLGTQAAGDIASGTAGTCSWSIDGEGALVVRPTNGESGNLSYASSKLPWKNNKAEIVSVRFEGKVSVTTAKELFSNCNNLKSVDLHGLDVSAVKDFTRMFENCTNLEEADLSVLDSRSAENLRNLFNGCSSLKRVNLAGLDTSSVTDMAYAFGSCTSLDEVDLSGVNNENDQFSSLMFGSGSWESSIKVIITDGTFDLDKAFPDGLPEGVTVVDTSQPVLVDLSSAIVTAPAQTYTGSALTPAVTVKLGGAALKQGTDYEVSYASNVNAGTATVTVTGKGNYTGTAKGTFSIARQSISSATVTAPAQTYTGSALTPAVTVKLVGATLRQGTDYEVSYAANVNAGTATVTVTGKGNYTGTAKGSFSIARQSISSATVTAPAQTYTGSALTPAVTVKLGGTTLKQGTDYTVAFASNVNAGTATVTVTGKGNYTGTAKGSFTITKPEPQKVNLSSATIGGVSGWTYDGKTHTVTPTVTLSGKKLTAGADYTVSGTTSTRAAGTYTLTITGAGGYTGTASKSFTVARKAVTVKADNKTKVQGDADPTLTAMVSGLVGSDKVTYSVSRAAGETPGTYTITPSGKATQGNYQVTYTKGTLTITEKPSEQPFEGTVLEELRHDVKVARASYDAAVSGEGNVDVAGAQAEVDQAQAAYDKAYTEQQAAQAADATAKKELGSAQTAKQSAQSEKTAADKAKSSATTELSKATSAYDAAKADADTVAKDKPALEAIAKAQSSYDAAVAKQKDAQSAYDKTQAASKAADAKVTEAQAATQGAKTKMDAAAKALADAQAAYSGWDLTKYNTARGSLGFFEYVGSDVAVSMLTTRPTNETSAARFDRTIIGAEGDATSLDNMKLAIEVLEKGNEYRELYNTTYGLTADMPEIEVRGNTGTVLPDGTTKWNMVKVRGNIDEELAACENNLNGAVEYISSVHKYCEPIVVSDQLMACAQLNTNSGAVARWHETVITSAEILAFGYSNPYAGWYDYERKAVLKIRQMIIDDPNYDPWMDPNLGWDSEMQAFRGKPSIGPWCTGHYYQVIGTNAKGGAVNTHPAGTNYKYRTDGQNSMFAHDMKGPTFTVAEYYERFMDYYNKVKAAEAAQDTSAQEAALAKAKAAYEAAKKAESARSNEAKTAKDAVAKAQTDLDAAKKATTTAKNTLAQVKAANPTSGLDPDTVARNLEAKRAAYDAAKSALDAVQTRVSTATQTLTQADKRLATATTQANSAAARLTSATQALASAEASLSQAKDRLSRVTANAQSVKAKADALAAAQAALDAATDVSRARVEGVSGTTYDGSSKKQPQAKLVVTVSKGNRSEEYELTQSASGDRRVNAAYAANKDAGNATVTLSASGTKGSGTFWGSKSATFTIAARKISDAKVDSVPAQTYTGSALKPSVSVTADKALAVGKDYELSYANNLNAGTARVTITGKGNYAGTRTVDFTIAPKMVGLSWSSSSFTYDGKTHAPKATATGLVGSDTCTVTVSGAKTAAGTYTATATKLSNANYALPSGVTHKFTIAQRAATVTANAATKAYGAKDPALTATVSGLVGSDKLTYSLARKAGEAVGSYAITASGASSQGNYQVTFKGATFTIAAADIAGADVSAIADQTRTGKQLTPKPTVRMGGTILREGTDYTLAYANNTAAGTATVTITGKGNYTGTARTTFRIVDTATPIPLPPAPDPITPDPSDPTGRFPDVKEGSWYYKVVNRAADLGLIAGYDDGRFGPNDPITRGQVAVILWRLAGMPRAGAGARDFSDVKTGKYYYAAVRWASSVGVVSGYGTSGKFGPEDLVTREQLAVMLSNYARCVARRNATGSAADYAQMSDASKVSEYARPALGWAFRNKILTGTNDGRINPQGNATRAEAAKMLVVFYDMLA